MNDAPTRTERRLRALALLGLALLVGLLAWQCRHGLPLSANLLDLVPHTAANPLRETAQARVDEPLSRQLVVLVGAADANASAELAREAARRLDATGAFAGVRVDVTADIPALRKELLASRLAMLPEADRRLLEQDPAAWLARRAGEIADPFASAGAVPLRDDLLGLTSRIERAVKPAGEVQLDLGTGTLQADARGKRWTLIHAGTRQDAFDQQASARVAEALADASSHARARGGDVLAAGGMLYSHAGASQAKAESARIGAVSIVGILLVLLLALRRPRALLAFVPVLIGMAAGTAACIAVFGQVHALTLAIGMSLLGIAVDFPLHWLGKSYGLRDWRPWSAMRRVRTGLAISLATTLVGYVSLVFTPFPALTQTAVFSAAGLAASYVSTELLLPGLMRGWQPRPWPALARAAAWLLGERAAGDPPPAGLPTITPRPRRLTRIALLAVAALVCAAGIARLDLRDDLRSWIGIPPALFAQAQAIGEITGALPTSQFFLTRAADADALLDLQARLSRRLDALVADGKLRGYDALSQAAAPRADQQSLQAALARLAGQPDDAALWQPLTDLGLPAALLRNELRTLAELPPRDLPGTLASPLAERWRGLWLGDIGGQAVGLVTLQGLNSVTALAHAGDGLPGVELVDRSGELNTLFHATRIEAAELKVASYLIAGVLLWLTMGARGSLRILAVPLAATICTLAALGFAGQPLTLFSLFGLLLVTALGVDYAIFMYEGVGGAPACLIGIVLGALTTLLSFGTLAASATPAIASFGLTVAIGVLFSVCLAVMIRRRPSDPPPSSSWNHAIP